MKRLNVIKLLCFAAITSMMLSACVKKDITFTLTIPTQTYAMAAQPFDGKNKTIITKEVISGIVDSITKIGLNPSNLKSVKLKTLNLSTASGQTFNDITFLEGGLATASIPYSKIAYKETIPQTGLTTLAMDNQYSELVNFFKGSAFTLTVTGYNQAAIPATTYSINMTFDVTVGPN